MTNTIIYIVDAIIFVIAVGGVTNAVRKDIAWYNERQKQKQLSLEEKR